MATKRGCSGCHYQIVTLVELQVCFCGCPLFFRGLFWHKPEVEGVGGQYMYISAVLTKALFSNVTALGPYLHESWFSLLWICYFQTMGSSLPHANIVLEAPPTVLRQMWIWLVPRVQVPMLGAFPSTSREECIYLKDVSDFHQKSRHREAFSHVLKFFWFIVILKLVVNKVSFVV